MGRVRHIPFIRHLNSRERWPRGSAGPHAQSSPALAGAGASHCSPSTVWTDFALIKKYSSVPLSIKDEASRHLRGGRPRRRARTFWPFQPRGPAAPETSAEEGEARAELPGAAAPRCRAPAANQVHGFHSCPSEGARRNAPIRLGLVMNRTSAGFLHPTALGGLKRCLCPKLSHAWVRGGQPSPPCRQPAAPVCAQTLRPAGGISLLAQSTGLHPIPVLCSGCVLGSLWYPPLVSSEAVAVLAVPTFSSCPQFRELWMSQKLWGGWGSRSVWKQCLWVGRVYVPFHPGINQPPLVLTQTTSRAGTRMDCCLLCSWYCSAGARPNHLGYTELDHGSTKLPLVSWLC